VNERQQMRELLRKAPASGRAGSARMADFSRDGDDNARAFPAQSSPDAVLRRFIASAHFLAEF
jgi:hypothetical protein